MSEQKKINSRIVHKHDYEINWEKATGFIPKQAELIVYDIEVDENGDLISDIVIDGSGNSLLSSGRKDPYKYERFKIGDGITAVSDLPFVSGLVPGEGENSLIQDVIVPTIWNDGNGEEYTNFYSNSASGYAAIALGSGTQAIGDSSYTEGSVTTAEGNYSHAEGYGTLARGRGSHAQNYHCEALHDYSTAGGYDTQTGADCQAVFGKYNVPVTDALFIIGNGEYSKRSNALTIGKDGAINGILVKKGKGENSIVQVAEYVETNEEGIVDWVTDSEAIGDYAIATGEGTIAQGKASFSQGSHTQAEGDCSHAEGYNTTASGDSAHAEGSDTEASGLISHAEGWFSTASGKTAHAEGYDTEANGDYSHTEGRWTKASGECSHTEGYKTIANGENSHAEGGGQYLISGDSFDEPLSRDVAIDTPQNTAEGMGSHAEGVGSLAYGVGDHVEGSTGMSLINPSDTTNTEVQYLLSREDELIDEIQDIPSIYGGYTQILIGHSRSGTAEASGRANHVEGAGCRVMGDGTANHVEGYRTYVKASNSHAEGAYTTVKASCAHAEGGYTTISSVDYTGNVEDLPVGTNTRGGAYGHAEGLGTYVSGNSAHGEGKQTISEGEASHSEGKFTRATGTTSHAEGYKTIVNSSYSHAEGRSTEAINTCCHAEGQNCVSGGQNSHAEGYNTTAIGQHSHSEGASANSIMKLQSSKDESVYDLLYDTNDKPITINYQTDIDLLQSVWAVKPYTLAQKGGTHAEGHHTLALGKYSHARNESCFALHEGSTAGGCYTRTGCNYQTVVGKYNAENTGALFVVGGGSSDKERSNAFAVNENGNVFISSSLTIGSTSITSAQLKELLSLPATVTDLNNQITTLENDLNTALDEIIVLQELLMADRSPLMTTSGEILTDENGDILVAKESE